MAVDGQVADDSARLTSAPPIPSPPQVRSRRNPRWIALGVIAICLGAIASFFLYSQVAESHQVIAVRHSVSRGEAITADDLGAVRVGNTGGLATVPASSMGTLVGKVAAFDLVQGSLLPVGAVTDVLPPGKGNSVIGIKVATGRAPGGFLASGSPVRLVVLPVDAAGVDAGAGGATGAGAGGAATTTGGSAAEVTQVATINAVVVTSSQADDGVFVNLELGSDEAVDAASYAAQDRVVIVRESER